MSKGEYHPGDPKLLTIVTPSELVRPARFRITVVSHDERIRAVRVRLFLPSADTAIDRALASDSLSWTKDKTGDSCQAWISERRPSGLYQIVVNTKKEAWMPQDISGLLFFGKVQIG